MKYLVTEIQVFENGTISTPSYAYDNQNSADAKYHSVLAAAAVSRLPIHSCIMYTEEGFPVKWEHYKHAIEAE